MSNSEFTQVFNTVDPLVDSGQKIAVEISQQLVREGANGDIDLLSTSAPDSVHISVEGPQIELLASDIVGVFPTPGSDTSPDEFLPHIALSRRTLPWERRGPKNNLPWLALLLFKQSELGRRAVDGAVESRTVGAIKATHATAHGHLKAVGLSDSTSIKVVFAPSAKLKNMVSEADLPLLCHVRRLAQDNPLARIDDDRDVAVVVGSRLPDAGGANEETELHHAFLVSLEQRSDVLNPSGSTTPLIVLHHWSFTPSKGGDFEQVIKAIRVRPNGGVLRFGNLPKKQAQGGPTLSGGFAADLDGSGFLLPPAQLHQEQSPVEYRGPLRPFAAPPRSSGFAIRPAPEEFEGGDPNDPPDYSHAAAFEIGRLATLAGEGLAEALHQVKLNPILPEIEVPVLVDKLPDALRRPDWVVNPAWSSDPWILPSINGSEQMLKGKVELLQPGETDFTGIAAQSAPWKQNVVDQIEQLAGIETPSLGEIEIGSISEQLLHEHFEQLVAATKVGH